MALILDPTLATAQDSQSRRPLVEILSQNPIADIPFDGNYLTTTADPEWKPNAITHSTGRLCLCYYFDEAGPAPVIRYVYTDVNRGVFNIVDLSITGGSGGLIEASLCELANGNIGIVFIQGLYLRYLIITVEGIIVTACTTIETFTSSYVVDMPFVTKLFNDSYLLVYYKKTVAGPSYRIMKRTSANFASWSAEAECSIGGTSTDNPKYNPSLLQITTGDIFLWFEYVESINDYGQELVNIYYSISIDNGGTWGVAVKITAYDTYGQIGRHPTAVQKVANQLHLFFNQESGAIHMDNGEAGWCGGGGQMTVTDLTFDDVTRKLYAVCTNPGAGAKSLITIIKIDVDTWTIDPGACWNCGSVPAFNPAFCAEHVGQLLHHGERYLIPVAVNQAGGPRLVSTAILNGETDTITYYHFIDNATYGIIANVTGCSLGGYEIVINTWVDYDSQRIYVLLGTGIGSPLARIGYIDLTSPGPTYAWNELVVDSDWSSWEFSELDLVIVPSYNYIILSAGGKSTNDLFTGRLKVYMLSDGALYKDYKIATNPGFPWHGLLKSVFSNNKIYGGILYEDKVGEEDKRGLCIINLLDDSITYSRPTWDTIDEYQLWYEKTIINENRIIMSCIGGITIYDLVTGLWSEKLDNTSFPGLNPGNYPFLSIAYDDETGMVFSGAYPPDGFEGYLVGFNEYGFLKQSQYKIGTFVVSWSFGATAQLVQGLIDYDFVGTLDPDQAIYGFWTDKKALEYSIKWDKENSEFDLSPYLVKGNDVEVRRSIDGDPTTLRFTLSHGHYFDRTNTLSLWSIYLRKARKITLRFGEKVGGIDYWQNQGTFYIDETAVSYERPSYPIISVLAKDRRLIWDVANIIATTFYETDPQTILEDVMTDHADLGPAEMDFPVFDYAENLYYQWLDVTILEILKQVCNRFAYFPRIDVDGKITARKISENNPIDHVYSDLTKVINYTPDDSFSDYTNQVIVMGEGRDWMEVLHNEEPFGSKSGAAGWWHKKKTFSIWYSDDRSRRCRYPRLEIIESVRDGPYFMKDGREYIASIRSDELGFLLRVEGPDLVKVFVLALVIWIVLKIVCAILNSVYMVGGMLAFICYVSEAFAVYNIMAIMGTQGLYQYNFYARPVGQVRQSFQGVYDDEDFQTELGFVVTRRIEDPFCYTLAQCNFVAGFEGMIARLQRGRVRFRKLAHLQDEEGDTIQLIHPVSGQVIRLFATEITRVFRIPSSGDDGIFEDNIEGWLL